MSHSAGARYDALLCTNVAGIAMRTPVFAASRTSSISRVSAV